MSVERLTETTGKGISWPHETEVYPLQMNYLNRSLAAQSRSLWLVCLVDDTGGV